MPYSYPYQDPYTTINGKKPSEYLDMQSMTGHYSPEVLSALSRQNARGIDTGVPQEALSGMGLPGYSISPVNAANALVRKEQTASEWLQRGLLGSAGALAGGFGGAAVGMDPALLATLGALVPQLFIKHQQ